METIWMAFLKEQPIGMFALFSNNRLKTGHVADIYSFFVRPENRGKGIGKKLLEKAVPMAAKERKCECGSALKTALL